MKKLGQGVPTRFTILCSSVVLGTTLAACTAQLDGSGDENSGSGPGSSTDDPGARSTDGPGPDSNPFGVDPGDPNAVGPMPLERLTRQEYNNTVRDLLGSTLSPADDFPADAGGETIFPAAGLVSVLDARALRGAAEELAAEADLSALVPCNAAAIGERECASLFIQTFGGRAYRRPVLEAEEARLLALYDEVRADPLALGFDESARVLLEAMLQSPAFLYHWELGPQDANRDGDYIRLSPHEIASRLSYFLWQSMPDDALLAAATAGELNHPALVEEQARRLLSDPRAEEALTSFFEFWAGVAYIEQTSKSSEKYPQFTDDLKLAMLSETRAFSEQILFRGGADFAGLFTSVDTFANSDLADVYGAAGPTGDALAPVSLDPAQRSGVFTQAAFLSEMGAAEGSNPTRRGAAILERVLCGHLPDPPNVIPPVAEPSAGGTTRDRFATHAENPCATGCHSILDPIGFAFEHYDGIGQYRTTDNSLPVDASGSITLDGEEHEFYGALELSALLASSDDAKKCFASQWLQYGLRRRDLLLDGPSLASATDALVSENDIMEMIVSVATSRSFRYRVPALEEAQP